MITRTKPVNKRRPGPTRRGQVKDGLYLAFVRRFPCVICWGFPRVHTPLGTCQVYWEYELEHHNPSQETPTEAAHVGIRGIGQKCSDRETIPLCARHHRTGKDSAHVLGKGFWQHHSLGREQLIANLNQKYEEQRS